MVKITRQLDQNSEGGGNNKPLSSLWDDNSFNGLGEPPIEKTEAELQAEADKKKAEEAKGSTAEVVKAETEELTKLLEKDTLTDAETARKTLLSTKYNVEEVDDEGKPLTEEAKKAIKETTVKLKAIQAKPEAQRTVEEIAFLKENTEAPSKTIYQQVDELTGVPLEINYQGKDPLSPEGVIIREEFIKDQAVEQYDAQLKESFPRAYQFLTHMQAGGKEEDFFRTINNDFSQVNLTKTDVALQESVYRQALGIKGISPASIDILVTTAKDKGKLFDESKVELEALQAKQTAENVRLEAQVEQARAQQEKTLKGFATSLEGTIAKGINGVQIPLNERQAFARFMGNQVFYDNGRLLHITEVTPASFMEELAANYFRFKKGDLGKVVERKANSINAEKMRKTIKIKITPKATNHEDSKMMPLGQI